jgi:hypothetical protein
MQKPIRPLFHPLLNHPVRFIFYFISLTIARGLIQVRLYQQGFISVSADEFSRGIRASRWAQNPTINLLQDIQGTWLPLEKYLNGIVLLVWPEPIIVPRLTVFFFSTLLLIILYLLAYELFERISVAVMTTLLVAFLPWFIWLSGTPMLEMYYFTFFFAGLLFLIRWLKYPSTNNWIISGICFLFATGFHVQSWTFVNLINLLLLSYAYVFVKNKNCQMLYKLFAFYLLSNGLIITFTLLEFFYTNQIFRFLQNHTLYSKWYYGGYDASTIEKFFYYPDLIYRNTNIFFNSLAILGFLFLVYKSEVKLNFFILIFATISLLLNSTLNVFSVPPTAAPDRYSLFYTIILTFYVAVAIESIGKWGLKQKKSSLKYAILILLVGLISGHFVWQSPKIINYPQGMSIDSVNVGRQLSQHLQENDVYMVELLYWDFLAIQLLANPNNQIIYDRERNLYNRQTVSVFAQNEETICYHLQTPHLRYIVLQDVNLKEKVQQIKNILPVEDVGRWTIYELASDFVCN